MLAYGDIPADIAYAGRRACVVGYRPACAEGVFPAYPDWVGPGHHRCCRPSNRPAVRSIRAVLGAVHRTASVPRGERSQQNGTMAQPPFHLVAGHRAGAGHHRGRWLLRARHRAVHLACRRAGARRRAWPHRPHRRVCRLERRRHQPALQGAAERRIAYQRRLGHRGVPVRHRRRHDRRVLPRQSHWRVLHRIRWRHRVRFDPWHHRQPDRAPGAFVGSGKHDVSRAVRGVHAVHRVFGCRPAWRQRHPGRGCRRPGERHCTAHGRAERIAPEHRVHQRVARHLVHA